MKRAHTLVDINGLLAVPKLLKVAKQLGVQSEAKDAAKEDLKSVEKIEVLKTDLLRPLDHAQIENIRKYTADKGTALLGRIVKKLGKGLGVVPPRFAMTLKESDYQAAMMVMPGFYNLERPYDNATFLQFQLETQGELQVDRPAMGDFLKTLGKAVEGVDAEKKIEELIADLNKKINEIRSSKWPGVFASYPVKNKQVPIIFVPDMEHKMEGEEANEDGAASAGASEAAVEVGEKPPFLYATFRSLETAHTVVNLLEPLVPVSGIRNLAKKALAGAATKENKS